MHQSILVAFDFDHTIANENTDIVARKLLPYEKLPDTVRDLYRSDGWIAYMGKIFELLHGNSIDIKQIISAIVNISPVAGIERLLKELHACGCEIIIISDSNTLFISEWLKNKNLHHLITETFTNPAKVCDNGMIHLDMYHVQNSCKFSTVNLCKGQILEDYVKRRKDENVSFDRIAYVGDGKNDLCPILRLSENDYAFPRKDYVLLKMLNDVETHNIPHVNAHVFPWTDGMDIFKHLQQEICLSDGYL